MKCVTNILISWIWHRDNCRCYW